MKGLHSTLAVLFVWALVIVVCAWTPRVHRESWYQERWAAEHGGAREVRLADGTRVDVLTATQAVEVEFAPKWAESIGQALYYGAHTGKQPAVVLIVRGPQDAKYAARIRAVAEAYGLSIAVYEVTQ